MCKLTALLTFTAAALMTLIAADASAATLAKKSTIQSEPTTARLSAQTIVMKQNIAAVTASRGSAVMLNPQPLPPRWNPASTKALNPQPLPPRWNLASTKALNPQPLPPRWNSVSTKALNPQPLPPGPNDKLMVKSTSLALQNYKFAR